MEEVASEMSTTHKKYTIKPLSSLVLPFKTRLLISYIGFLADITRRKNSVNRCIVRLAEPKALANSIPIDGVTTSDLNIDPSRNLWCRLFVPVDAHLTEGNNKLPIIVYFHGGGFAFFGADTAGFDLTGRAYAKTVPSIVVSVNYRLSPEHRFPCQYDDGFDALKYLDNNPHVLPETANLSRCFLGGDSAGGNLAHHVAVRAASSAKNGSFQTLKVIGMILIQPFFGGEERVESEKRLVGAPILNLSRTDWLWKVFLPVGSDRDHAASNVMGKNAIDLSSVANFPKTLIFIGAFDPTLDWQKRYIEWLKSSGKETCVVEYPNGIHAFYFFPQLPEAWQLFLDVKEFVTSTY